MDLLTSAYATPSDEDEDEKLAISPSRKRPRNENSPIFLPPALSINRPKETLIPGRYVSKRERAISASTTAPDPILPSTVITSPAMGSISDSDLPRDVYSSLKCQSKVHAHLSRIPDRLSVVLNGHTKAVNAIQWSPTQAIDTPPTSSTMPKRLLTYVRCKSRPSHDQPASLATLPSSAHLLASASMDQNVCIWNVWSKGQKKARIFTFHNAAVKDLRWSQQGLSLLSCGYDCSSRLVDIEKAIEMQHFKEDQTVGAVRFHPGNSNLFLSGGSKGFLRLWDIRVGKVVQEYLRGLGPILDIEFSVDAKRFISSSDVSKGNVSENSIIVWDVQRQVPLSNQVYVEAYTCPCIRYHPFESCFVAQSNGNYIAIFSSRPPFKLDKYKRYEKHSVSGFPIKCNFSLDGEKLASGSSDGSLYFYSYRSAELVWKIKAYEQACIDVAFHPTMPNVIASCSWNGVVSVFE